MGRLAGKVALVTGGSVGARPRRRRAVRGDGAQVVVADVDDGRRGRRGDRRRRRRRDRSCRCDVTDDESVRAAVRAHRRDLRRSARALQQRRHLARRRRRSRGHRRRDLRSGRWTSTSRASLLLPSRDPGDARRRRRQHRQRRLLRGPHGRGDAADRLHHVEGRGAGDDPGDRRRSTPATASGPTRCVPGR